MPYSKDFYTIPFDKAIPLIVKYGKGDLPLLPLCMACKSDCATHFNGTFENLCDTCYIKEIDKLVHQKEFKQNRNKTRNNKICSTCGSKKAYIKNGKKYKTCEDCLIRKREERLRRIKERESSKEELQ